MEEKNMNEAIEVVEIKEGMVTRIGHWIDKKKAKSSPKAKKGLKIAAAVGGTIAAGATLFYSLAKLRGDDRLDELPEWSDDEDGVQTISDSSESAE